MNKKSKKKINFFVQHAWQTKTIMITCVQQDDREEEKNLKNKVKEERERQGISQEQLSNKSEVSRTIISELENGKTDVITNVTLEKIAKALGKRLQIFFLQIKYNIIYINKYKL